MKNPSVVDANCMKYFQEERLSETVGIYTEIIEHIRLHGKIAIDDQGFARQEYYDCCRPSVAGLNLCDWIADEIVNSFVIACKINREAERKLLELGVPKKDLKWPAIAIGASAETIVTEDIDLFAPKLKTANKKVKDKARSGAGPVSTFLRRRYGINVCTSNSFYENY